jgi:hypothetical protein
MMLHIFGSVTRAFIVASLIALTIPSRRARGCAPAPRFRETVRILQESAIIIWNPATHTEHFIRRASFNASGADFGFLVPTPSQPSLAEVESHAFDSVQNLMKPRTVVDEAHGVDLTPLFISFFSYRSRIGDTVAARPGAVPPVRVIDVEHVAGYDAVVLEADNPSALSAWLGKHDYASGPDLKEWLAPYVAARWKITAFKIAKNSSGSRVGTAAVLMSFTTDHPFFPYREPASQREPSADLGSEVTSDRGLTVFFVGDGRVEGRLGAGDASRLWPAQAGWSDELSPDDLADFASNLALGGAQLPQNPWLTAFEDRSSPRPGIADLYFARSQVQGPYPPPAIITVDKRIPIPIDVFVVMIGIALLVRSIRRRAIRRRVEG